MAYDWKYDTNVPETVQLRPMRRHRSSRAGWLTRLFNVLESVFGFAKKSGDYNRKA